MFSTDDRYDLVLLDLDKPHNQFIKKAVQPYLHIFQELPEGLCVYFEAFGTQIGSRFCGIPLQFPHLLGIPLSSFTYIFAKCQIYQICMIYVSLISAEGLMAKKQSRMVF